MEGMERKRTGGGGKGDSRRQGKQDKATIVARSMLDFYKFNSASYDKVLLKFSRSRMSNCQLAVTPAPAPAVPAAFLNLFSSTASSWLGRLSRL